MLVLASTSNRDLVEVLLRDHQSSNIYLYYYLYLVYELQIRYMLQMFIDVQK